MKRILTLLTGALAAFAAWAVDITEGQARTVAGNFVAKDAVGMRVLPGRTVDAVTKRGGLWLVTLKPSGHVFVSANRSAEPIPSFSENDFAEPEVGSPQAALLSAAETNAANATGAKHETRWRTLLGEKVLRLTTSGTSTYVAPLLASSWSQGAPYSDFAPVNAGTHEPNGCVGTAYAQIMRYWEWPERIDEDFSTVHSADSSWGFTQQLWAGTALNWSDMPLSWYSTESDRMNIGRATMLCGMLAKMGYAVGGSKAQNKDVSRNPWYTAPDGLDCNGENADALKAAIVESLNAKCPILVGIGEPDHSIVCDGCSESGGTFYIHLNYGWGGTDTAHYTLSSVISAKALSSIYYNQRPRPMALADAMAAESTLPLTLKWAFPTKGYEESLDGFTVKYAEVDSNVYDWQDDFSSERGTIDGAEVAVETISCDNATPVLNIRNAANQVHYTWPAKVLRADSKLSFRVRSNSAIGMKVVVQAYNPSTGWETICTPELAEDNTVSDWQEVVLPLPQYAEKAVGLRVGAQRVSSRGASGADDVGVQFDDFKITNVRDVSAPVESIDVAANVRSYAFTSAKLANGKTYVFAVEPKVAGGIASPSVSTKVVSTVPAAASIDAIASVRKTGYQVQQGFYREGYLGLNQFGVYGSDVTTGLVVRLSHPVLIDKSTPYFDTIDKKWGITLGATSVVHAVSVEKVRNGKFLVKLDFGMLTDYVRTTRMMVTFDALDAKGNVARKDFNLLLNNLGGEAAITKDELPDYGGSAPEPEPIYYAVAFDSTGGSSVSSKSVKAGEKVGALATPSKDGYTFVGWFTASTGGDPITANAVVNGAVTFYAQWKENVAPGGDDPVVDPSAGNPNDFTEGSVNYRFCNGASKTNGFFDVHRSGTYNTMPPISYNLIYWWVGRYKAAFGGEPSDYSAPNEANMATTDKDLTIAAYTATLLDVALKTTLPAGAERATYFPSDNVPAAYWQGTVSTADKAVQIGRHIYAALAKGPIGFKAHTSSAKFYCGVIWGCEYGSDDTGKYATKLWVTDTRAKNDGIKAFAFANCSNSYGDLPGLRDFNGSGNHGVIEYYYPIVGPIKDSGGGDEPGGDPDSGDEPDDPPVPDDPDDEPEPDAPIGVASNAGDPGKFYTDYGYTMNDNYWTARKLAIQQRKQLFILSGAAWCSNCSFVKDYLDGQGAKVSDNFIVYFSDHDSTTCNYFNGGLPQYGVADPRTVDAFTGTLNGSVRSWDLAWQTATSGIYAQDRGGYAPERVKTVLDTGIGKGRIGSPVALEIRGLATLATGHAGQYELYATFDDGVEMPVDHGVTWSVVSGDGTVVESNAEGKDVAKLTINSGAVTIKATSTFYFTGSKSMTVAGADIKNVASVAITTTSVNLEDDATPLLDAIATMKDGSTIPVVGFGDWSATFLSRIPREDADLEEDNQTPSITFDDGSRMVYAPTGGKLAVCDQKVEVGLTVNGKSCTKEITVWGPTKVAPSKWKMVSGPRQTKLGVVRLQCTELKYNYGGKIYTTADTYFASYKTVLKFDSGTREETTLRGLTAISTSGRDENCKVGLAATKVNGKFAGYSPADPIASAQATNFTNVAEGEPVTGIARGEVPTGFFNVFWPTKCAGKTTDELGAFALEDSDGDGFANWEEYVLGTDPTNKGDAFTLMQGYQHLTAPAANGDTMQYKVMYQQRARRVYYIEAKKAWGEAWTPVATVSLQNMSEADVTSFTGLDADGADNAKFFRVKAALYEHTFNDAANAPVIAPNMLVANRGAVIDLSDGSALDLTSFDTDATDPGTVWVKVAADVKKGTALMTAPVSAEKSLMACKPYERTDLAFAVVKANGKLALKVAGEEPALEEGQGEIAVEEDKVVVTPNDGVTEITLANVGERQVEIPSSVEKVGGVGDAKKLTVKGGGHDVTKAMKFTPVDGGFKIELDETAVVSVGGEDIPVCPVLADGNDETPFEVKDGQLVFTVKTIPGLKYEVLEFGGLGGLGGLEGWKVVGQGTGASTSRCELTVDRPSGKTQGFYKIQVSR